MKEGAHYASSYLVEIEHMHAEVLTHLKRYASEPVPAEAACMLCEDEALDLALQADDHILSKENL